MLFTSTKHFQHISQTASTGTTNRNYLQEDLFLQMQIPLPALPIQNQLVSDYQVRLQQASQAEQQASQLEQGIETYLLDALGIEFETKKSMQADAPYKFLQMVDFKDISRWDTDFLKNQELIKNIFAQCKHKIVPFGNILLASQYGISEKAHTEPTGYPMLRMNNILDGVLDISDLKYVEMEAKLIHKLNAQKGDLLFNRTNSKELVGKTAVFDLEGDYLFASYLIRLKIDTTIANVYYINYIFNAPIVRKQIDMISRQILGQANVNLTELSSFLIPLPPLPAQNEIVTHINTQKAEIKRLKAAAERLRQEAKEAFEREIFN
jgi:restriction endonuclease S subunit